jgi:hypothetical protein
MSRKKSDLKFSASILEPTMKLSGPCSMTTTQQKVARINAITQPSLRSIGKRVFVKFGLEQQEFCKVTGLFA